MKTNLAGFLSGLAAALAALALPVQAQLPEFRTINGISNNLAHPTWGSAGTDLLRRAPPAYADGTNSPVGTNRPSARLISNLCVAQSKSLPNAKGPQIFSGNGGSSWTMT